MILSGLFIVLAATAFAHMQTSVPFKPVTLNQLERFHGHVGPFVAVGALIGEHAVTQFDIPRYFGLSVTVECPNQPPQSCIVDGLMVSTGATMGKRNIVLKDADTIRVVVQNDETNEKAAYTLSPEFLELLSEWETNNIPITQRGEDTFHLPIEKIVNIKHDE